MTASLSYSLSPGQGSTSSRARPRPSAMPSQVWRWRFSVPVMTASKAACRARASTRRAAATAGGPARSACRSRPRRSWPVRGARDRGFPWVGFCQGGRPKLVAAETRNSPARGGSYRDAYPEPLPRPSPAHRRRRAGRGPRALARRAGAGAPARSPTPAQTEGPFYPVQPAAGFGQRPAAQRHPELPRRRAHLGRRQRDRPRRAPAAPAPRSRSGNATQNGHYHHPGDGGRADAAFQGFGRVAADADGQLPLPHHPARALQRPHAAHPCEGEAGRARTADHAALRGRRSRAMRETASGAGSATPSGLRSPCLSSAAADGWSARFPIVVAA